MPTAAPDVVVALAGTPTSFDVLANDSGTGLVLDSWTQPAHGSLVHDGGGRFTYTANAAFAGVDGFTYTVRDSQGATATGTVTISVLAPNQDPVAADDVATTTAGTPVDIPVLANDADPDGDPLTISGIGVPAHGSVALRPGQAIRYVPQPGFTGIDRFVYTIEDGRGGIAQATVTVQVGRADAPPEARDDAYTVESGTTAVLDPLANDVDPDGDVLRLVGLEIPAHGRIAVVGGRIHYTPDPGFEGEDGFDYTVADGRGGTATARVRLTVVRPNLPPTAQADVITTTEDTPVVLDLLANDADPDGDPLRLAGLELPAHGQLALAADGTLTYTPDPGFTGQDSFTYTVADGRGGHATATVTITVQPSSALEPRFANGYARRRRILLPPQEVDETLTDFRLLVRFEDPSLRSVAQGGMVESDQGYDIRFEAEDGTPLAHDLLTYDPAAGRLVAFVRLPSWRTGIQTRLHLYYGKPGLATSEADPAATWQGNLAVWHLPDGSDRTGQGRDLTTSGLGTQLFEKLPLATFDGSTSAATLADPGFLSGHPALSLSLLMIPEAAMVGSDRHVLLQGPIDATAQADGLVFRFDDFGGGADADDTWFFVVKTDAGEDAWYQSSAHIHEADVPRLVHLFWQSGQHPGLFLDGRRVPPAWTGRRRADGGFDTQPASGLTAMVPGHALSIGIGSLSAADAFVGRLGLVRFAARVPTATEMLLEARNLYEPWRVYGVGPEERADMDDFPPVASDLVVSTPAGTWVDLPLDEHVFDPEGQSVSPVAVGNPLHGSASVVQGRIRYTPAAGYVGNDSFSYTVADPAGGQAQGRVHMTVTARTGADPASPEYPLPRREVVVRTGAELATALAGARPGDHIILEDGDYSGLYEMRASGTPDDPIVIRARRLLGARIGTRGITFPDAAVHDVMIWGIDFRDCLWMPLNGSRITFRRCRIWPRYKPNGAIAITPRDCSDIRFDYCTFRLYTTDEVRNLFGAGTNPWDDGANYGCVWTYITGADFAAGRYPRRLIFERIRLEGGPSNVPYGAPNCQFIEPGGWPGDTNSDRYPMNWTLRLIWGDVPRDRTVIDIKGSHCLLDRCHIKSRGGSIQIREGWRHEIRRCRFENTALEIQSHGHRLYDVSSYIRLGSGTFRWDDPVTSASVNGWRNAHDIELHNCRGTLNIGHEGNWAYPAEQILVAGHTGTVQQVHAAQVTVVASSPYPASGAVTLTSAEVGHDAPWVGIEG